MKLARFENIVAIKTDSGRVVGFHSRNLDVARLDSLVWKALQEPESAAADVKGELLSWNQEMDPNVTDGHVPMEIRSLSINVAQICNLRCIYCAADGDGTYGSKTKQIDLERTYKQLEMLLSRVPAGQVFTINFLGGEPLIYPHAIEAIADQARTLGAARDVRINFEITTNGTLVSRENAELLAKLKAHVTVSIDGAAEINDKVRPTASGRGATGLTLNGIERLLEVKDRLGSLSCNAVFGAHNIDVIGAYRFLRRFAWDMIYLSYAAGPDDATYSPLYADGMSAVARLAYDEGGETELRRISQFDHYFRILDGRQRVHNYCGAGKSLLQIDTDGRFYACNWFVNDTKEELGRDRDLDAAKLEKYARPLVELNNCATCWARFICGGGCMFVHREKTGDKHKKDDAFCNRTRRLIAKGIEYYEQSRYEINEGV